MSLSYITESVIVKIYTTAGHQVLSKLKTQLCFEVSYVGTLKSYHTFSFKWLHTCKHYH